MAEKLLTFTDDNWEREVLGAREPVLVDFWAEWCKPCLQLVPILEQLADHYNGKVKIGKLNVEENAETPFKYNVTGLPTLLLLKGGTVLEQRKTLVSREALIHLIDPHVG
jgi:thioredoxin 1